MDYISPNNIDDHDCAEVKEMAFHRNPWLILYTAVLVTTLIIGGVSAFRYTQKTKNLTIDIAIADQSQPSISPDNKIIDQIPKKSADPLVADAHTKPLVVTIRSKDNLGRIFKRFGLSTATANSIAALKQAKELRNLKIGKKITLVFDPTKTKLQELSYEFDSLNTLIVTAANQGWRVKSKHIEPASTMKFAAATIDGSIYTAAKSAGVSRKLMAKFVNAFSHKVNMKKIREGDSFSILYKEYTLNGKIVRDHELAAGELMHQGKKYRIVGFTDSYGRTNFYTTDGRSVKPSFNRYPLANFDHIGSRFSYARRHPILSGVTRPHLGVDFSARRGTPVKATSDGKVTFAGTHGGHGKTIMLRHGHYKTLYAHLSRFGKNIHSGKYVKRGDVIGYVGATGLATGPHLHYEVHFKGVHRDPLKFTIPFDTMIDAKHRSKFFALSKKVTAQLEQYKKKHKNTL